ncbi:MFS general substrate transporter [Xylariaceae sp. FL0016]|nr:MFS general substrate transporter [Xylariaceae sp. FL0016]
MVNNIVRILSRPTAKPYRTGNLRHDERPYLDENGHVAFRPGDIENPHEWSSVRRWYVTVCAVMLVLNATFASSAPSGCIASISEWFSVSEEVAGLTITLFLLGYCAGPLVFAPLSEFYGRRWIFYITFSLYFVFNFLCAWAPNFASLLVGRFLTGTFVSAPISNAPGVLADLWGPVERGNAMAVFSCIVWVGPAIAPVISGFLQLTEDWRWSFYVLLWLAAGTIVLMFTLPETFGPILLVQRARRIRKAKIPGYENVKAPVEDGDRSLWGIYKVALTRPWLLLLDPISFLCAVYMSIVYCLLYMLFSIYPIVFQQRRGWNSGVGELPLIGTAVGACIGGLIVVWDSKGKAKQMEQGREHKPEDRLTLAIIGGIGFPVTMFWFAWTAEYNSVHWAVPTIAGVFLGTSMMLIFVGYLNYLVDVYLAYAASALAVNTVARSACGAVAPLFTRYMFDALGVGGGGSLVGGVGTLLAIIPFAFYKYGESLRKRSKFSPTKPDKPDDEERQQSQRAAAVEEEEERHDTDSPGSSGTAINNTSQQRTHHDTEKSQ